MPWIEPKTDWGFEDSRESIDFNRVEGDTAYLANLLNAYGYLINLVTKTDWQEDDLLLKAEAERGLANVKALVAAYMVRSDVPELPGNMENLNFSGANAIELALLDIYDLINNMVAAYRHAGTFYAGQGGLRA